MTPLFFIHIPKTAGTSLNTAAENLFGTPAIEKDYSAKSTATSPLVWHHIYAADSAGPFALVKAMQSANKRWLTGHVFAQRYVHLLGAENTISFVRDPIDRVISEYRHRTSKEGEGRSFTEFYKDPLETNKQFRMIGQLPWQAFHLVGVQDQYDTCLDHINATKNLTLAPIKTNVSAQASADETDSETREDIRKWNERDCIFVEQVRDYLTKQLETHAANKPFCFHDMGFVPEQHIIGWAFYLHSEEPVDIGLYIDGILVEKTSALEHRPELQNLLTPRAGHNGFRFVLAPYGSAQSVCVKALNTDQTLFEWQRET